MKEKEVKKVDFHVTKPTTLNSKFYGPGARSMDAAIAAELYRLKCGIYVNKKDIPEVKESGVEVPLENPRIAAQGEIIDGAQLGSTELPEDFPSRDKLIEAGFETIESLQTKDAEAKLGQIDGLPKAEIKKIGLALSK